MARTPKTRSRPYRQLKIDRARKTRTLKTRQAPKPIKKVKVTLPKPTSGWVTSFEQAINRGNKPRFAGNYFYLEGQKYTTGSLGEHTKYKNWYKEALQRIQAKTGQAKELQELYARMRTSERQAQQRAQVDAKKQSIARQYGKASWEDLTTAQKSMAVRGKLLMPTIAKKQTLYDYKTGTRPASVVSQQIIGSATPAFLEKLKKTNKREYDKYIKEYGEAEKQYDRELIRLEDEWYKNLYSSYPKYPTGGEEYDTRRTGYKTSTPISTYLDYIGYPTNWSPYLQRKKYEQAKKYAEKTPIIKKGVPYYDAYKKFKDTFYNEIRNIGVDLAETYGRGALQTAYYPAHYLKSKPTWQKTKDNLAEQFSKYQTQPWYQTAFETHPANVIKTGWTAYVLSNPARLSLYANLASKDIPYEKAKQLLKPNDRDIATFGLLTGAPTLAEYNYGKAILTGANIGLFGHGGYEFYKDPSPETLAGWAVEGSPLVIQTSPYIKTGAEATRGFLTREYQRMFETDPTLKYSFDKRGKVIDPEAPLRITKETYRIIKDAIFEGKNPKDVTLNARSRFEKNIIKFGQKNKDATLVGSRSFYEQAKRKVNYDKLKDADYKFPKGTNLKQKAEIANKQFFNGKGKIKKLKTDIGDVYNIKKGKLEVELGNENIPSVTTKQGLKLSEINYEIKKKAFTSTEPRKTVKRGRSKDLPKLQEALKLFKHNIKEPIFTKEHIGWHAGEVSQHLTDGTFTGKQVTPSTWEKITGQAKEAITYFGQNEAITWFRKGSRDLLKITEGTKTKVITKKDLPRKFQKPSRTVNGAKQQIKEYLEWVKKYHEGDIVPSPQTIAGTSFKGKLTGRIENEWIIIGKIEGIKHTGFSFDPFAKELGQPSITKILSRENVAPFYKRIPNNVKAIYEDLAFAKIKTTKVLKDLIYKIENNQRLNYRELQFIKEATKNKTGKISQTIKNKIKKGEKINKNVTDYYNKNTKHRKTPRKLTINTKRKIIKRIIEDNRRTTRRTTPRRPTPYYPRRPPTRYPPKRPPPYYPPRYPPRYPTGYPPYYPPSYPPRYPPIIPPREPPVILPPKTPTTEKKPSIPKQKGQKILTYQPNYINPKNKKTIKGNYYKTRKGSISEAMKKTDNLNINEFTIKRKYLNKEQDNLIRKATGNTIKNKFIQIGNKHIEKKKYRKDKKKEGMTLNLLKYIKTGQIQ